ncbi:MAG: DNA-3-methyladenine glycosylase I [Brooklawnia sp.]|uniref:DNA-3-methyladenine glycosylase I n=1 Tax=Brooklawnia sp. TaxID=2699740 RepID=UPI003C78239F
MDNPDLVVADDGRARPLWAVSSEAYRHYYDTEWGVPVTDESGVFERLSLEAFQSGLSWATILAKRDAFRRAFAGFVPDAVAGFDQTDVYRLLADAGIVRNRRKIEATIGNARATVALRAEGGLAELVWSHQPERTPAPVRLADIRTTSPEAIALSKALKGRGFSFVGPTTIYALMQAIGLVDDHLVGSWRRGSSGVFGPDGRAIRTPPG